jgi:hypothetical protein
MTREGPNGRAPLFSIFLIVACAGLAVLVVVLARQNQALRAALTDALEARQLAPSPGLQPGDRLSAATVIDTAGSERTLDLASPGKRLLMVASAQCPTCESVRPFWRQLAQWAGETNVEPLYLLTDRRPQESDAEALGVQTYGVRQFKESSLGRVPLVPALLLVRDGVVERVWLGSPEESARDAIAAAVTGA